MSRSRTLVAVITVTLSAITSCSKSDARRSAAAPTSSAQHLDSTRRANAEAALAADRDQWNKAEVMKRLAEAGLVVKDEQRHAMHPPLEAVGDALTVSGSEMQLFIYADAASRKRASAALDTTSLKPGVLIPALDHPRYVISNNLIAVYATPDDRLAERIENALMARHLGT